ncbi:MAG: DUF934 domain-containing protein [Betaproteobacteria bacterium]
MAEIIRGGRAEADRFSVWRPPAGVEGQIPPPGPVLVPLAHWLAGAETLQGRRDTGVWLAPDDDPLALAPWIDGLAVVAVDFPKFTDGRGYSSAYLLRNRLGYRGELRAIGDVLPDQLAYLKRVGFDAFALRPDKKPAQALAAMGAFSEAYQGSTDQPRPVFRRGERPGPAEWKR